MCLAFVSLASCRKDPTLEDRLEGAWKVNDITASGFIQFMGQNIPLVANDKTIDSSSVFTLVQGTKDNPTNTITYNVSSVLTVSAGQTFDFPFTQNGTGSWTAKAGNNVAPDSLFMTASTGAITKYEVLALLEKSVLLRTKQIIALDTIQVNTTIEFGFIRQ